jgi:hypothetical protein
MIIMYLLDEVRIVKLSCQFLNNDKHDTTIQILFSNTCFSCRYVFFSNLSFRGLKIVLCLMWGLQWIKSFTAARVWTLLVELNFVVSTCPNSPSWAEFCRLHVFELSWLSWVLLSARVRTLLAELSFVVCTCPNSPGWAEFCRLRVYKLSRLSWVLSSARVRTLLAELS